MRPASRAVDGDEHRRGAVAPQRLGLRSASAGDATPSSVQKRGVAERDAAAIDPCRRRPCRSTRLEVRRPPAASSSRSCARRDDGGAPADARCRAPGSRPGAAARPRRSPRAATIATSRGLPSVSVPVLSTTSVSTFSSRSSASAFLISTPACAPRPDADHDRHRRRQPERAGTGDDQHGDRVDQRIGQPGSGPQAAQATKVSTAISTTTARTSPRPVRQALDRRPAALGLATISTICASTSRCRPARPA